MAVFICTQIQIGDTLLTLVPLQQPSIFSMYINIVKKLFIIGCCILSTACASHYGSAKIVSDPPGAEVINDEDGSVIGITPTTAWWKDESGQRKPIILRFKKEGYFEKVSQFFLSMRHTSEEAAKKESQLVEVSLQAKPDQN